MKYIIVLSGLHQTLLIALAVPDGLSLLKVLITLPLLLSGFFLIVFLIAYFISLSGRFKSKKTIKNLNAAATSQLEEIAALKKEVESLQSGSSDHKAEPKEPS